jgi:hypothetical protein
VPLQTPGRIRCRPSQKRRKKAVPTFSREASVTPELVHPSRIVV